MQDGLNVYATYYLALAHLENNRLDLAEPMFRQVLNAVPTPDPGKQQPYYVMFWWGANANLARIQEARRNTKDAISHYNRPDPTPQGIGNRLKARELLWAEPLP